jgi:hypothetical protein
MSERQLELAHVEDLRARFLCAPGSDHVGLVSIAPGEIRTAVVIVHGMGEQRARRVWTTVVTAVARAVAVGLPDQIVWNSVATGFRCSQKVRKYCAVVNLDERSPIASHVHQVETISSAMSLT